MNYQHPLAPLHKGNARQRPGIQGDADVPRRAFRMGAGWPFYALRRFSSANGFVSRVVSAIFNSDHMGCYSDARHVMEIMNGTAGPSPSVSRPTQNSEAK